MSTIPLSATRSAHEAHFSVRQVSLACSMISHFDKLEELPLKEEWTRVKDTRVQGHSWKSLRFLQAQS